MLGLALFAQGVVAANACDVLRGNVTKAFSVEAAEATEMPCHEEATSNANACLAHCTQGDQVSVDQSTHTFAAPSIAILVVDAPAQVAVAPSYLTSRVALNTGPPVSIRFCTYQI